MPLHASVDDLFPVYTSVVILAGPPGVSDQVIITDGVSPNEPKSLTRYQGRRDISHLATTNQPWTVGKALQMCILLHLP